MAEKSRPAQPGAGRPGMQPDGVRPGLVSLAEIQEAASLLASVAVRTPLVPVPRLSRRLLLKPESLQPTGSFKLRGAYTAIRARGRQARERGVVAHSSGNHGHAVAYAAALLGVHAVVVVPSTAPKVKTDAIRYYGAELVTVAPTMSARLAATEELAARHGYVLIPPFDDRTVIAGQGTVGLEIADDRPHAEPGRGVGHRVAVVAAGMGDDSVPPGGLLAGHDRGVRPAQLERPGGLQRLGLDQQRRLEPGHREQRGADRHPLEPAGRVLYLGQPDQPGSAHPVSPSGVAPGTGNYPRQLVRYD